VQEGKREARNIAREYFWNYLSNHPCIECGVSISSDSETSTYDCRPGDEGRSPTSAFSRDVTISSEDYDE